MKRSPSRGGFTLIEMITVMAVIVILVSLVLSVNSYVQKKAAERRTKGEIAALELAIKNYEADNAAPPRDEATTDVLDPRQHGAPASGDGLKVYKAASQTLYMALSGDTKLDGKPTEKSYAPDFFKPERLKYNDPKKPDRMVEYVVDPFGNCYGYSTMGLKAEQEWRQLQRSPDAKKRDVPRLENQGFNSTFDLWSTGGSNIEKPTDSDRVKWIKNW